MGYCYLNGLGGAALNFRVVPYSTEAEMNAATPRHSTIGIVTDVKITEWIISKTAPKNPSPGMLWIEPGTTSLGAVDVLKTNSIIICPISAYQYISDIWVEKIGKTYLDGTWRSWEPESTYLFTAGNQYTDITGGWSGINQSAQTLSLSVDKQASSTGVGGYVSTTTAIKVNVSEFGVLSVTVDACDKYFTVSVRDDSGNAIASAHGTTGVIMMDLANVTGSYYIKLEADGSYYNGRSTASFTVSEVKLVNMSLEEMEALIE